jgi:hypothetical protein
MTKSDLGLQKMALEEQIKDNFRGTANKKKLHYISQAWSKKEKMYNL